jgi:outer membrane receptor protein involved in Fe transport
MNRSIGPAILVAALYSSILYGQTAPTPQPPAAPQVQLSSEIVVAASKLPEDPLDVPADTTVIQGADLRARGVQTLGDALATAPGVEALDGSDAGANIPNVALWGLKEFDAYLVEIDGVPAGGAFDPDLQQIDVRNIDRIEIVRGPAGAVHGSTAFAGVIAIYTRFETGTSAEITAGNFGNLEGRFSTGHHGDAVSWQLSGDAASSSGWRARTDAHRDSLAGAMRFEHLGGGVLDLRASYLHRRESFGAPFPVDSDTGVLSDGVTFRDNLALSGTQIGANIESFSARYDRPMAPNLAFTNITSYAIRNQRLSRSFVDMIIDGEAQGAGSDFSPRFRDLFEDVRLAWTPPQHHLLVGLSVSHGTLTSAGRIIDVSYPFGSVPPQISSIPNGDAKRVTDRRTFAGLYAEDAWSATPRLTVTLGGRYDRDMEHRTFADVDGTSEASRTDGALSGRAGVVYRLLAAPTAGLDALNVFASYNRTFKPAAFDPAPGEDEGILNPERSRAVQAGVKLATAGHRGELDFSVFDMRMTNLVVSSLVNDTPTLINAGEEQFRGFELEGSYALRPALRLTAGFSEHQPRFIRFEAVNENGEQEVFNGKSPELVARHQEQFGLVYTPDHGIGWSLTLRHVGKRPLDRDNIFYTDPFWTEDASLSLPIAAFRLEVVGRNLGNKRYYTTDSELQDGLRYVSSPRSYLVRVGTHF